MGMKLLSLHTIPWCYHLLSNHMSCFHLHRPEPPLGNIKLIKSDGVVETYDRPINVSDLMTEFPKHMVCRSDSFYIGQKIPPLSKHDHLELGNNYFLLPKQYFQSVLSFVTIASFANAQSRNAVLKKAAACHPFDIQKSSSGCLRIRVSDEFIRELLMEQGRLEEENEESRSRVCSTALLQKQYEQLVGTRHNWKPKLDTIKETEKKKRRKISSFGIKRKKKSHISELKNDNVKGCHRSDVIISSVTQSKPKFRDIKLSRN